MMERKMLIVFKVIPRAINDQEREDFFKSLKYSHSGEVPYQIFSPEEDTPHGDIFITIGDDCLVLGPSWDKYIKYALEEGLPQHGLGKNFVPTWEGYVQAKMGLQSRRTPEGIFPDLEVALATR
jgi:hypothetical protein